MMTLLREAKSIEDLKVLNKAMDLALELAQWFTPERTKEEIELFCSNLTASNEVKEKAIIIWISAMLEVKNRNKAA